MASGAARMKWLLILLVAALALSGCKSVPGEDGRYATPSRGGWDNFRA
ncbi:MAG: hypothetical protein K2Y40_23340 [Reyranella sp.]|nr:hypothetical protein [Reyranella sp.]